MNFSVTAAAPVLARLFNSPIAIGSLLVTLAFSSVTESYMQLSSMQADIHALTATAVTKPTLDSAIKKLDTHSDRVEKKLDLVLAELAK